MRDAITTVGEIVGLGLVSYGAWLLDHPVGLIVAGLGVFGLSVAAA